MLSNVLARSSLFFFSTVSRYGLGVLLGLCMDGHHLDTTNKVWSGHFLVLGWACHFHDLFCSLLLLVYLLLHCL
jgi:hypothetical protein